MFCVAVVFLVRLGPLGNRIVPNLVKNYLTPSTADPIHPVPIFIPPDVPARGVYPARGIPMFLDPLQDDENHEPGPYPLEAQQRYFSYRAILAAIVSQNSCVLVFMGIAQLSRDMLQNGVSHRCACVKLIAKGGIAPFWGSANLPEKVSRDMGYRSDSIAVSREMGPLSPTPK